MLRKTINYFLAGLMLLTIGCSPRLSTLIRIKSRLEDGVAPYVHSNGRKSYYTEKERTEQEEELAENMLKSRRILSRYESK